MTLPPHSFRSTRGGGLPFSSASATHLLAARHGTPPSRNPPRLPRYHAAAVGSTRDERDREARGPTDRLIPPLETFSPILTSTGGRRHHRDAKLFFLCVCLGLARERGLPCCPVPRGVCFVLCHAVKQRGGRAGRQAVPVARFPSTCCVLPASRNRRRWPAPRPLSLSLLPCNCQQQRAPVLRPDSFPSEGAFGFRSAERKRQLSVPAPVVFSGGFWGLRSAEIDFVLGERCRWP